MPAPEKNEAIYSQKDRLLKIETVLGEKELILERFSGTEGLSMPFQFRVVMLSTSMTIDMKSLLRTPATITITLADEKERYIHAIFSSIRQRDMGFDKLVFYEAVLVPSVWFLSLDSDCKIYQNKTVKEIVESVLKDNSIQDFEFALEGTYTPREYCVQYRESSLNFISRLLEEEGIFYFFEHEEKKHKIVFKDRSKGVDLVPKLPKVAYSYSAEGWRDTDGITSMERIEQVHTGKVALTDYFFEKPTNKLLVNLSGEGKEEFYDYPGNYTVRSEGDRYARIRLEQRESDAFIVEGTSRSRAFISGYRFTLEEHYREDTNQEYVLISVTHDATDTTHRAGNEVAHSYRNVFTAIPRHVPYRPPRRARRPIVQGPQTALVVGTSGDEITVDKYGRVKVQFYWDRVGKKDENSSCWVRVSQSWAGKNWGWMTIPRVGQEVVVDFLEGNPDYPLITGRVYNADQMPPYALPANQTQSGLKSRSSKSGGSDNFNEIRFEDLKGSEMLTIHAEKDMETTVENDDTQTIQNNRVINVDGTHTETIVKDTTIEIKQGNHSTTVDMGNQSIQVKMGNQTTKVDLGKIDIEAMQSITLKVGQSSIVIDQMGVTVKGMMIKVQGQMMTQVSGEVMLTLKGGITMIN